MNKKLAAALAQCGFEVTNNAARGVVQGFEMNAAYNALDNSTPLTVHISCYTDDEAKRRICDVFRAEAIKFTKYSFTPYGFELGLNDWTAGRLAERIGTLIKFATDTLKANGAAGIDCCPVCGKPLAESASKPYAIGDAQITVHDSCIGDINKLIESENIDFENAPNNYLKGFLGALIGGVAGAALSVCIYIMGFISSIAAIIAVLLGSFLYKKFGGKPTIMMIVIVSVTTLVCMVVSIYATYITAAAISAAQLGLVMSPFEAFGIVMSDAEFAKGFYADLGMLVLFTVIGIGLMIFDMYKGIQRQKTIK